MAFVDKKLTYDENLEFFDFIFDSNGKREVDESFDSHIAVSIGTDARATDGEVKVKKNQRGNLINIFNKYNNGSKLWLLQQARNTEQTKNLAIKYMKNSLKWLIDDGYLKDVIVTGRLTENGIILNIELKRVDGGFNNFQYNAWDNSIYKTV